MSGYKRFVSYVYRKDEAQRQTTIGFVRVYVKNEEWNFVVHIEAEELRDGSEIPLYLCVEDEECTLGVFLENSRSNSGVLDWEGSLKEGDWELDSPCLRDTWGLRLDLPGGDVCTAVWEGERREYRCFRVYEKKEEEIAPEPSELKAQSLDESCRQRKWDYLAKRFVTQSMFGEQGTPMECIKIRSGDLSRIPRDSWVLGNNSFLLHGYYQYRHLLLCRQEEASCATYYLGVPGYMNEREHMMAELFGFSDFKSSGDQKDARGEFGYWFRKIEETKTYDNG